MNKIFSTMNNLEEWTIEEIIRCMNKYGSHLTEDQILDVLDEEIRMLAFDLSILQIAFDKYSKHLEYETNMDLQRRNLQYFNFCTKKVSSLSKDMKNLRTVITSMTRAFITFRKQVGTK